jgi:hypothetical protein
MNLFRHNRMRRVCVLVVLLSSGCVSVPKEAVELSYRTGEDLSALHHSYRELIRRRFEDFRRMRLAYLENEWTPGFLGRWVRYGHPLAVVQGQVVWSLERLEFVSPPLGSREFERFRTIGFWAQSAIEQIEKKKARFTSDGAKSAAQSRAPVYRADSAGVIWARRRCQPASYEINQAISDIDRVFGTLAAIRVVG